MFTVAMVSVIAIAVVIAMAAMVASVYVDMNGVWDEF